MEGGQRGAGCVPWVGGSAGGRRGVLGVRRGLEGDGMTGVKSDTSVVASAAGCPVVPFTEMGETQF